jgi:clan AA aspartic protease (TIGR02281 family)
MTQQIKINRIMKKTIFLLIALFATLLGNAQSYNFEQGVKAFKEYDLDKALEYFGREINDNPKAPLSYYYRAIIYNYQEQNSSALSDINNAIKYFSGKEKALLAGAHRLRGDIYVKIENYDKTFEDYSIALKLTPDDPDIYIDRAQIYFDLKQYQKAESDYKQALKIDESLVEAWAGLSRNYLNQKKYPEAEKTLNKLIKLAPDYTTGYKFRARYYYELQKYNDAIEDIFYAFLLDDSDKGIRSIFISYSEKNYSLSLSKVNSQISAHPEKDLWYFIRAQLYEGKYNFAAAIKDYNKVMELSDISFRANLLGYRAKCYLSSGMYELAISDYNEIISIDSTDAYNYGNRGDAKRLMGEYTSAIDDFTKAIEVEPRESWFYYRRGWTREFMKEYEAALNDYNEAILVNDKYTYTYLNRGRLYESQLKNPVKAKENYLKILSLDTTVNEQGNCRHYALFHLGRKDEAIAWLNKIIEQYPNDANYYDATCLYSLMNNSTEALSNLKIAFTKGYRDFVHLSVDDDLDNIRNMPEFKSLVQEWKTNFEESLKKEANAKPVVTENKVETVTIPMTPKGSGIYEVSCKVNDLRLNFIFDTGASDISISQTEALFMLKNGYLNSTDIGSNQRYMDANGDIEIGTKIIFRKVEFGGLILKNVSASVVNNKTAPLLFGQSALSKYGKIIIDNQKNTITISNIK